MIASIAPPAHHEEQPGVSLPGEGFQPSTPKRLGLGQTKAGYGIRTLKIGGYHVGSPCDPYDPQYDPKRLKIREKAKMAQNPRLAQGWHITIGAERYGTTLPHVIGQQLYIMHVVCLIWRHDTMFPHRMDIMPPLLSLPSYSFSRN